tara:strand:- start:713 stop:940 length:228 start_codon:yes stop_codon:yes gene_type:complete
MKKVSKLLSLKEFSSINEGIQNDVEAYIKKNKEELDSLADEDKFDEIYQLLYTDFDADPSSKRGKDLKQAFDSIF